MKCPVALACRLVRYTCYLISFQSLLFLPLANLAYGEVALVQLQVPQRASFSAGDRVPVVVRLLVKGQFAGPTYFDLPEVEGAIIMQVSQRPVLDTLRLEGETYARQSFDFALYAQQEGTLLVAPFTVRFGSRSRFDQPVVEHQLSSDSFYINVQAPAGAQPGELILSAASVLVTETWLPEPIAAKVGDAFIRTISISAEGVAAMLLPVPTFAGVEGLASYNGNPQVIDQTERGAFLGKRIDSVTYVCEREGVFEIPELAIRWWNPEQQGWQTRKLPAVRLEVAPNPGLAPDPAQADDTSGLPVVSVVWIQWLTGSLFLAALLVMLTPRLMLRWRQWIELRSRSEAAHWARLLKACRKPDAVAVYGVLNQWLALFGYASTDLTLQKMEGVTDRLAAECIALQQNLVGLETPWDRRAFFAELIALRRIIRKRAGSGLEKVLPPLNPA